MKSSLKKILSAIFSCSGPGAFIIVWALLFVFQSVCQSVYFSYLHNEAWNCDRFFWHETCTVNIFNSLKPVIPLPHDSSNDFERPWKKSLLKTFWLPAFSPFPIMFSTLPKTNVIFSVTYILLSVNASNLGQSKISAFGKELKNFQML